MVYKERQVRGGRGWMRKTHFPGFVKGEPPEAAFCPADEGSKNQRRLLPGPGITYGGCRSANDFADGRPS